jgi:hypothetical protein
MIADENLGTGMFLALDTDGHRFLSTSSTRLFLIYLFRKNIIATTTIKHKDYLRNRPRGGGLPPADKSRIIINIQQQTDKIDPNAMYILVSLSPESADGPADGPADVGHASVLHSLSSIVGLGHAVPP